MSYGREISYNASQRPLLTETVQKVDYTNLGINKQACQLLYYKVRDQTQEKDPIENVFKV